MFYFKQINSLNAVFIFSCFYLFHALITIIKHPTLYLFDIALQINIRHSGPDLELCVMFYFVYIPIIILIVL